MSIDLVGPDGREYHIESDNPAALAKARALGYRTPDEAPLTGVNPENYGPGEGQEAVGAAARGLAKGLSFGVSDALTPEGPEREMAAAADEAHPYLHGAGELAGAVLSPVNELAPLVEGAKAATVLGRVGQKVLGGAAVGSLFGAGNTISDAALGDTQVTAEKLFAGMGMGAVLGGLGGGVGGALEEGAAKVLPKLGTVLKGGQSALDEAADHLTLKAFRNTSKELQRYSESDIENAVNVTRERGHLKLSPEAMGKSISEDAAKVGAVKGGFLDAAEANGSKPVYSEALKALDDWHATKTPLQQKAIGSAYREARESLQEIASRPVDAVGEGGSGWRELDRWKQDLQSRAKYRGVSTDDSLTGGLKRELAGVARSELDRQLVPALGDQGQAFLDTKKLYGSLKTAERLAHSGAGRGAGFSPMAAAAGIVGGVAHPLGLVGSLGWKFMEEHGANVAAQIADRIARSPALAAVAESFAKALPTTAPKLGRYGPSLMLAAQRSPQLALAQHMVTAQVDPEYAANAQLAGLRPESPAEHVAALGKATDLAAIHATLKAHDVALDEAMKHVAAGTKPPKSSPVLKTQEFGAKQLRRDSAAAHEHIVGQIRQLASSQQTLVDRVASNTGALANAAPGVTAHMTSVADRAVKYLAAQSAVPPKPGPMAKDWVPTETERHKFALALEAVQEPMSLLRHAAKGTLTRTQIQAVSSVYPQFMESVKTKALEQMTSGETMPYQSRLMLSMLTGYDADGTTSPKAIAANQQAIAAAGTKPSGQAGEMGDKSKMGFAGRAATPGQKDELKEEAA